MNNLEREMEEVYNVIMNYKEPEGTITCVIYDDQRMDLSLNFFRASFTLKKEDLKDYVYREKVNCPKNYEDYYFNRTYKLMYIDDKGYAIFYRNY